MPGKPSELEFNSLKINGQEMEMSKFIVHRQAMAKLTNQIVMSGSNIRLYSKADVTKKYDTIVWESPPDSIVNREMLDKMIAAESGGKGKGFTAQLGYVDKGKGVVILTQLRTEEMENIEWGSDPVEITLAGIRKD